MLSVCAHLGFALVGLSDNFENCITGSKKTRIDHKEFPIRDKQSRLARDTILNLTILDSNKIR